jgi:hypothetical protein
LPIESGALPVTARQRNTCTLGLLVTIARQLARRQWILTIISFAASITLTMNQKALAVLYFATVSALAGCGPEQTKSDRAETIAMKLPGTIWQIENIDEAGKPISISWSLASM